MKAPPSPAEVLAAARALIAYSDARDREVAARLSLAAAQYAAGREQGNREGETRVHEWYAEQDRELAAGVAEALARPARTAAPGRWHLCCRACRLGGHRNGCPRCEDRTRATFGDPHPDDYPGGARSSFPTADTRRGAAA